MTRLLLLALDIDLSRNRGDTIHLANLAKSVAKAGNLVHLVVGANPNGTLVQGVTISIRPEGSDPKVLAHVIRAARTSKAEVIYERRTSPKISAAASIFLGLPYVVEINGMPEEDLRMQGRSLPSGPLGKLKSSARVRLLRRAAGIATVTSGLRDAVISRYNVDAAKVHVVPNGVDGERFYPRDKTQARQELKVPDGPIVCFVGNLVRWHGLDTLIEATRMTSKRVTTIVVGDGPERENLLQRAKYLDIENKVRFVGQVEHHRVPQYIAAADACAAPFTADRNMVLGSSALKMYEYIACGRPVVATSVPGAPELVQEFGCGIVVPPDDPKAFAQALDQVVSDTSFGVAAQRASVAVRSRYSWDRTGRRVTEILQSVVKS